MAESSERLRGEFSELAGRLKRLADRDLTPEHGFLAVDRLAGLAGRLYVRALDAGEFADLLTVASVDLAFPPHCPNAEDDGEDWEPREFAPYFYKVSFNLGLMKRKHVAMNSLEGLNWQDVAQLLGTACEFLARALQDEGQDGSKVDAFTSAALRKMTGLQKTALGKYRKAAGVDAPGRGQRNHRYTLDEARKILAKVEEDSTEDRIKQKCRAALDDLG